mgnify:CR=1 FL=1
MLKLKIAAIALALTGLILLLLGDTYLTVGSAVVCTAIASPMSLYLTLRWAMRDDAALARFYVAIWSVLSVAAGVSALQDLNIINIPLGTTIDPSQIGDVEYCVSFAGATSILLATIAPWSPKRNDGDNKG